MAEQFPSLPWWALVYLAFVFGFTVAGSGGRLKRSGVSIALSAVSFCFITTFVIGYFHRSLIDGIDWIILPMAVLGVAWEFYLAVTETARAEEELKTDQDLSDEERTFLINFAIFMNALLVVPGYALGIKFCLYYLGLEPPMVG
jgi:threonine/homoserine/homoserine lactone efflux protein